MGLGLAAAHAWLLMDLALYGAIRTQHPIRGFRPDKTRIFRRELLPELSRPTDPPALQVYWWKFKIDQIKINQIKLQQQERERNLPIPWQPLVEN